MLAIWLTCECAGSIANPRACIYICVFARACACVCAVCVLLIRPCTVATLGFDKHSIFDPWTLAFIAASLGKLAL